MNDERLTRYAETIHAMLYRTSDGGCSTPDDIARAVVAVADAEVVASSVATLRVVAGVFANTAKETVPLAAVLETLYQVAERIEAGEVSPGGLIGADSERPS